MRLGLALRGPLSLWWSGRVDGVYPFCVLVRFEGRIRPLASLSASNPLKVLSNSAQKFDSFCDLRCALGSPWPPETDGSVCDSHCPRESEIEDLPSQFLVQEETQLVRFARLHKQQNVERLVPGLDDRFPPLRKPDIPASDQKVSTQRPAAVTHIAPGPRRPA